MFTEIMSHCPGYYCGRTLLENGNWSECGACPRGFRTNSSHCLPCSDEPEFYDWLYLTFIVLVALLLHFFCVDYITHKWTTIFSKEVLLVYISIAVEIFIAAAVTVLIVEPAGLFKIRSCKVQHLSDWYTLFHNPSPNYEKTLYCTQEAVYPLYTMVFIFYTIAAIIMIIIRPKYDHHGKVPMYTALYFYPILAFFQAVFGGIIYYAFPYIILIACLISSATHMAHRTDQSVPSLIRETVVKKRNITILIVHWLLYGYGIIGLIQLKELKFHWSFLALIPLPTAFYILTAKFTDPNKLHAE